MTTLFDQIEDAIVAVMAPALEANGGYLKGIEVFHGDLSAWVRHCNAPKPRAFVGIEGGFSVDNAAGRLESIAVPVVLHFLDTGQKDTRTRVTQSAGIYQMISDALAGLEGAVFQTQAGPTLPATISGGSIDLELSDVLDALAGTVRLEVIVPSTGVTPTVRYKSVRM
jgi:hypothetical protein